MKKVFLVIGIITILVLNAIILMGTTHTSLADQALFDLLVVTFDISLVLSSIYFIWQTFQQKQYVFLSLFIIILLAFLSAFFIRMTDIMGINVTWLFAFDLFCVNVYLVYLSRNWEQYFE
ncbi:MAG: hypothetical protein AB8G11_18240 [Saprospiraceae bacterium]